MGEPHDTQPSRTIALKEACAANGLSGEAANHSLHDKVLREAKEACETAAVVIDVQMTCAISGNALDAGEIENLRDTASRTIAALQRLHAALAASSTRGGGDA